MKKIGLIATNTSFMDGLPQAIAEDNLVKFMPYDSENHEINMKHLQEIMDWCDVAFFDFAHYPIQYAVKMPHTCKIVVRIHGLEIYKETFNLDWTKVDTIICSKAMAARFKNKSIIQALNLANAPDPTIIPIGVDVELFQNMKTSYGKKMCMVNVLLPRKRIYTTLETVEPFLRSGWEFHLRGTRNKKWRHEESTDYSAFINELLLQKQFKEAVHVWPKRMELQAFSQWYINKDIIINNSTQEGYGKSVLEAMACGVYPIVHEWFGASEIFPEWCRFTNQEELKNKITDWNVMTVEDKMKMSKEARDFVVANHNIKDTFSGIKEIVENV